MLLLSACVLAGVRTCAYRIRKLCYKPRLSDHNAASFHSTLGFLLGLVCLLVRGPSAPFLCVDGKFWGPKNQLVGHFEVAEAELVTALRCDSHAEAQVSSKFLAIKCVAFALL